MLTGFIFLIYCKRFQKAFTVGRVNARPMPESKTSSQATIGDGRFQPETDYPSYTCFPSNSVIRPRCHKRANPPSLA